MVVAKVDELDVKQKPTKLNLKSVVKYIHELNQNRHFFHQDFQLKSIKLQQIRNFLSNYLN